MSRLFPNLMFEEYQEKSFYHALRTKGFVILAGLSGTGKTKIVEEFVGSLKKWQLNEGIPGECEVAKGIIQTFLSASDENNWHKTGGGVVFNIFYRTKNGLLFKQIWHKLCEDNDANNQDKLNHFGAFRSSDGQMRYKQNINISHVKVQLLQIKQFAESGNIACILKEGAFNAFSQEVKKIFAFIFNHEAWARIFTPDEIEKIKDVLFDTDTTNVKINFIFIPIRPDFKDSKSLLGPKFHGTRQKLEKPIVELLKEIFDGEQKLEDYKAGSLIFKNASDTTTIELKGSPILVISEEHQNSTTNNNDENLENENHAASNNTKTFIKIGDKRLDTTYPHTAHKLFEMLYNLQTNGFASFI